MILEKVATYDDVSQVEELAGHEVKTLKIDELKDLKLPPGFHPVPVWQHSMRFDGTDLRIQDGMS